MGFSLNPISAIMDSAQGLVSTVFGNKAAKETNIHDEQIAADQNFAAENAAQSRENRNWWDSFVDGLNRLPRPVLAFMVIGSFIWAPLSPETFAATMVSYGLIPPWLTYVFGQIVLLYFGGRMLENLPVRGPTVEQVKSTLATIKEIKDLHKPDLLPAVVVSTPVATAPYDQVKGRMEEKQYQSEMADVSHPLSLDSIVEWNKRNQEKGVRP